ncbi:MAG: NADH-quinone oxidoreductase subunit H [Euzebyales bacterium]|nr:NADH-quinone oxidoreductase subunit H [Euzebyales bacterium]MBA3620894.1 NADH-quinone oxidoreductase subunit H [Euzebyales bacterium]
MSPWAGLPVVVVALAAGVVLVTVLDAALRAVVAGAALSSTRPLAQPWRRAAVIAVQQRTTTERPDPQAWALAPALLLGLAATMLTVVPLGPSLAVADVPHGIVLFGAAAAMILIPAFLQGWSPNSPFPLLGAYRMFAQGLSSMIPFALVLIAAALPAESLAVGDIVASQQGLWNVVRTPLGLPVYLVTALGLAFWGPLATPAGADLGGGIDLEASGVGLLAWRMGQAGILVGMSAVGASVFLAGWAGPLLPGPVWVVVKTTVLLAVLVASRHLVARVRLERYVVVAWVVLLPLALLDVFITGWWLL